ncbi:DUF427 domain-containing protein [Phenylobacterium sp.]|uniref:DUF427 domain-containing protein n=1 Tax=Phenylobacterium sp. TaxID=1871053 RepID=UPI0035AF5482
MKIPGPDHPIVIKPAAKRWRARFGEHVIADSNDALILTEASYKPVVYFPRQDVSMEFLSRTDRSTHCPYKGDASYFTLIMDGQFADNVVWSYEEPFPAMEEIRGRLAFYPDRVEVYEVDDAEVNPHHAVDSVDDVVLHTDAGDGHSQREHWPANVTRPPEL